MYFIFSTIVMIVDPTSMGVVDYIKIKGGSSTRTFGQKRSFARPRHSRRSREYYRCLARAWCKTRAPMLAVPT